MPHRLFVPLLLTGCLVRSSEAPPNLDGLQASAPAELSAAAVDTGAPAAKTPSPRASPRPAPARRSAAPAPPRQPAEKRKRTATLKFGGSTYLSNDDSMSLASAQRMLWALDKGHPLTPSQIRPHELLNYFTFETVRPDPGDTFAITASAERNGDQLALALAIRGASPPPPPLDLIVVVDRSGSMQADDDRMGYTRRALKLVVDHLRPEDSISIVSFANRAETVLAHHRVDDPSSRRKLIRAIESIRPGGGTNLDAGLRRAWAHADALPDGRGRNRRVMLLTDARVNQGQVDPTTLSAIGRRFEEDGLRLTGVGVGSDFNDAVLDSLTDKGKGAYVYLGSEAVVDRFFDDGFEALVSTIAHDVRFQLHLPDSLALKRFYGEEASTDKADVQSTNYFAGTSQVFLQDLAIADTGLDLDASVSIEATWRDPSTGEPASQRFDITVGQALGASPYNVRKARALTGFADVLAAQAMNADCSDAMAAFRQRAAGVDDPEITFVASLLGERCSRRLPRQGTVLDVSAFPRIDSVELRNLDGSWRSRFGVAEGQALVDIPPGPYVLRLVGGAHTPSRVSIGTGTQVCTPDGRSVRCR